jgi:hypothetical protein
LRRLDLTPSSGLRPPSVSLRIVSPQRIKHKRCTHPREPHQRL